MADVAYNTIIKIESETIQNPTIETMAARIANALDVKLDDIIKK